FGNSAIRQFGNSAIRQFGNSAIRQFGNSLNRSLTLAFLLALPLSAMLTVNARAQWTGTAPGANYNDEANWAGDVINDEFINPNWASAQQWINMGGVTFDSSSTEVSTGANNNAYALSVSQTISGNGIVAGTVITAITGSNTFTISAPTTAASSGNYSFYQINNPFVINIATRELPGNFIFNSTLNANVQFLEPVSGMTTWTFTAARPVISVNIGQFAQARTLSLGVNSRTMTLDFVGNHPVFHVNSTDQGDGNDTMAVFGIINNAASLTKTGYGSLALYRDVNISGKLVITGTFPVTTPSKGAVVVYNGANDVQGYGQGRINAAAIDVVGQRKSLNILPYGFNNDMVSGSAKLNLYSGAFNYSQLTSGTWTAGATQNLGEVNIYGRALLMNSSNVDNATLMLGTLNRQDYATLNLVGNTQVTGRYLGNKSFIKISGDDSNITRALVGGGGADGSTNINIIPWATAQNSNAVTIVENRNSGAWSGGDLVTYTKAGGFRALTASEYLTFSSSSAATALGNSDDFATDSNVALFGSGTGGTGNVAAWSLADAALTVNALKIGLNVTNNGVNHTLTMTTGQTLNITSGALAAVGGNNLAINGGVVNTGTNPLIATGRSGFTFNATVTNSITDPEAAGLIAAAVDNFLTLSGSNNYGGLTIVQTGMSVNNANALPKTTGLRIERDGYLRINANSTVRKLEGSGYLSFNNAFALNIGDPASTVSGDRVVAVNASGTLAPGDVSGDYRAGTLFLGSLTDTLDVKNLQFNDGSTFAVDLGVEANDLVQVFNFNTAATLTVNGGTLALNFLDNYSPDAGTSWLLTAGFAATAGDAELMSVVDFTHPDWDYKLAFSDHNLLLTLETIPEPSTWALLVTGAALLALLRRRK
ncbi:MAG: PEP-CTERM sorting domain-containing protein, partial [Verrucomicrobiales bacterium]|nr:PEP-CTERM sorting domain-containing protein [Verrucomicrobiales bacterium]